MSLHFVDNVALLVTVLVFKINALLWQHTHPQANQSANSVKRANHQFSKVSDTFKKKAHFLAKVFIVAISLGPGACFCVFHLNGGKF